VEIERENPEMAPVVCPVCGTENTDDVVYCQECNHNIRAFQYREEGKRIRAARGREPSSIGARLRSRWWMLLTNAIAGVVGAAFGLFGSGTSYGVDIIGAMVLHPIVGAAIGVFVGLLAASFGKRLPDRFALLNAFLPGLVTALAACVQMSSVASACIVNTTRICWD
jgi:hypothetical protein